MQLRADQIPHHLARVAASDGLRPVYTFFGDEPLQAQEAADAVRSAAREAGHTERQVHTVSGAHFDWSALLASASAMSLFSDRQLVEIRIPSGKPGKDGSEALQRYCEALGPDVITLVHLPRLDRQQQSSAWFTALDAAGVTVRVDPIERRDLPAWIARRLAAQGQSVVEGEEGERTLAFMADRVEGNLLAAHQEIQKLGLLYPTGPLGFEQVEQAVLNVARYDVFKLGEAVLSAQMARALRMLDGLQAEGEAAVLVHWTLAEDIRTLWRVHDAVQQGKPLPMALREQRVWGVKERLVERVVPRLAGHQLAALVQAASTVDGIVKGLHHPEWPHEAWAALRRLAVMTIEALQPAVRPAAEGRSSFRPSGAPRMPAPGR